jgi:hypothetical protein
MLRYENISQDVRYDGKRVYLTTYYPEILPQDDDTIIVTNEADYLDHLAFTFYNDPSLWWIIALANNIGKGRLSVPVGIQLRIPNNISQIINDYNNLNQ